MDRRLRTCGPGPNSPATPSAPIGGLQTETTSSLRGRSRFRRRQGERRNNKSVTSTPGCRHILNSSPGPRSTSFVSRRGNPVVAYIGSGRDAGHKGRRICALPGGNHDDGFVRRDDNSILSDRRFIRQVKPIVGGRPWPTEGRRKIR